MRAMILYEHCSPHQVTAVETARKYFGDQGDVLIPVEFYFGLKEYAWTLQDKSRSGNWLCFFPDRKQASNWELFRRIWAELKKQKIDVLVVNGWYGRFAWWLAALRRWLPCRLIVVSDSISRGIDQPFWKVWPKRWLISRLDGGFVSGTRAQSYLESLGLSSERITKGADVVDNQMYISIPPRPPVGNRKLILGTVARFIPEKNLHAAICAFTNWCNKHPDYNVEWRLAGNGPLEEELKKLASELGSRVVFPGFVSYYKVPDFYSEIDLYWQPSISDTWGLVINEAMAAGRPVLVSDRCGCALDLVHPDNGWIHALGEDALIDALETAWKAQERWSAMGLAGRIQISQWGCERFASGLHEVCRRSLVQV
ncbi:MAG TPA: glycosyltransferase family 4 protein [Gemmatales bacterium]|nr:glycosyltransferase family 4 protein [Gemmatales bacterium]